MSLICQPTSEDIKRHFITACANGVSSVSPTFHISNRLDHCGYTPVYWHSRAVVQHFPTVTMTALTPNACPRQKQPAAVCTIKRLRRAIAACERAQCFASFRCGTIFLVVVVCVFLLLLFLGVPHFFSTRTKKKISAELVSLLQKFAFSWTIPMPVVTTKEYSSRGIQEVGIKENMALYRSGTHTNTRCRFPNGR